MGVNELGGIYHEIKSSDLRNKTVRVDNLLHVTEIYLLMVTMDYTQVCSYVQ